MNKKFVRVVKVLIVALILLGAVVATSNFVDTDLHGEGGVWVKFIPDPVDCRGEGSTCYDMTGTSSK